jgi:hypothetical protein
MMGKPVCVVAEKHSPRLHSLSSSNH